MEGKLITPDGREIELSLEDLFPAVAPEEIAKMRQNARRHEPTVYTCVSVDAKSVTFDTKLEKRK